MGKNQLDKTTEITSINIGAKKSVIGYAVISEDLVDNFKKEASLKSRPLCDSFNAAMLELRKSMSHIYYGTTKFYDRFDVNKVIVDDKNEEKCIVLHGSLMLESENHVPVRTDNVRLHPDECPYGLEDFDKKIEKVLSEAYKYALEGNYKKADQGDLFEKEEGKEE